jgi:heat shock protein HslJ
MKASTVGLIVLGVIVIALVPTALAQTGDLAGTQWRLVSYGTSGAETPVMAGSAITIAFESGNQVTGNGGCNSYGGTYTVADTTITFSDVVSTMMACTDSAVTQQEQTYFAALHSATTFKHVGNQLTIFYAEGQLNFVQSGTSDDPNMPRFDRRDSPVNLLASYYDAINRQEYQRAYGYWETAPNPYDEFARGFADTASVQVIVQPPTRYGAAAGSLYVSIPTVLIAQHTDGTQFTYAGCFVARTSNQISPDMWSLYSADVAQVANNAAIPALLTQACPP